MGRQNQKKLCYSVLVMLGDNILHDTKYPTLGDAAKDLNLSYQQIEDLSVGRSKKFMSNFKYQPIIKVEKIF